MNRRPLPTQIALAGVLALLNIPGHAIAQHPLDSWVRRTVPSPSVALNSIAYGNGTFVAVGDNSFVARSTDGATWTTSTAGAYGVLRRVRFLNGQFVAVGASDKILYSSDGASWTASTLPQSNLWDVAWGNGVYVLAGNRVTTTQGTYVSSDGINWTQTHPIAPGSSFYGPYETPLDTVVFDNGLFLAMPAGGANPGGAGPRPHMFSTNGIDWIALPFGGGPYANGNGEGELVYQDGVWASILDILGRGGIFASTNNGASWTKSALGPVLGTTWATGLSAGQGYFAAFMWYTGIRVAISTNGFSWELRFAEPNIAAVVRSAAFGNGTFVAVGYDEKSESYILQSGNISGAPIIFQEPQDRSAVVDNPATFSVQAVGAPPLAYQWYRNGTAITDATNTFYTIAQVATGDAAGYHVVITNSIGSVTSRVAQLTVAFLDIDLYAGIRILGVPGRTYRIEATPASGAPNWQTLTNLVLPSNPYIWIDYQSPDVAARLYRAAELP